MTSTRRITFNLNGFIQDLKVAVYERPDLIDDEVQRYKTFLKRIDDPLLTTVKSYVCNHSEIVDNERLKSFIMVCH